MFGLGVFAVVMGTAAGPAGTALAQEPVGDVLAGRQFALEVCSECHFVAPEQIVEPYSEAPWFQDIADKPSTTELSLRVFLQSPHFSMPNFMLTPQETDDVISYILSLRKN
jgi:mono/diheme cytochrome c family protein